MTDTRTVDPDVETGAGDDLEDYECCHKECDQLATARATCSPCGCNQGFCLLHRTNIQRAMRFRFKANLVTPCGMCGTPVEAVEWGRM